MSDERLEAGEPCMVSISAGLRPIHKKAIVTSVKPKGYDVLCEGETTERHISEKKAKRLSGRRVPLFPSESSPMLVDDLLDDTKHDPDAVAAILKDKLKLTGKVAFFSTSFSPGDTLEKLATSALPIVVAATGKVEQVVRSLKPVPKPRPRWRSTEYLKFVGERDCCGCGKHGPSDAHHWGGSKGMALKVDDLLTVPLCNGCHIEGFHRTGKLPGMTTAETHLRFRETQVALLVEWVLLRFDEVSDA